VCCCSSACSRADTMLGRAGIRPSASLPPRTFSAPRPKRAAPQRANHSATLVEGSDGAPEVWVIGGQDNDSVMQDCWALEVETMAWRQVHPRCGGGGERRGEGQGSGSCQEAMRCGELKAVS
jgi:hypothetical protein